MAQEITLELFEKNAKIANKKGLRRQYSSIPLRASEYLPSIPLGVSDKLVLECTIDKEFYPNIKALLEENNFQLLGSQNYYNLKEIVDGYEANKEAYKNYDEPISAIKNDLEKILENKTEYKEIKDEDVVFYFLPFNDEINDLSQFLSKMKDKIIKLAKENDITIMFNVNGFSKQLNGFIGFNFFDADEKNKEVIVDYASGVTVGVDFSNRLNIYVAALLLTSISHNREGFNKLNLHIVGENLIYKA